MFEKLNQLLFPQIFLYFWYIFRKFNKENAKVVVCLIDFSTFETCFLFSVFIFLCCERSKKVRKKKVRLHSRPTSFMFGMNSIFSYSCYFLSYFFHSFISQTILCGRGKVTFYLMSIERRNELLMMLLAE